MFRVPVIVTYAKSSSNLHLWATTLVAVLAGGNLAFPSSSEGESTVTPSLRRVRPAQCSSHAKAASTLTEMYAVRPLQNLGSGSFSSVCRGVHLATGDDVAIKAISRRDTSENDVKAEVSFLQAAQHCPHVIRSDPKVYSDKDFWYIVMELAHGGDILSLLNTQGMLSEEESSRVIRCVASAISHLHSKSIVHLDVKPENIFCFADADATGRSQLRVKLADFGSCMYVNSGSNSRSVSFNTVAYSSPEILRNDSTITTAADVWSLGIVLYILLLGHHPFDVHGGAKDHEMMNLILTTEPDFESPLWNEVSPSAKDLAKRALSKDPAMRPTSAEMMAHPWVTGSSLVSTSTFAVDTHVIPAAVPSTNTAIMSPVGAALSQ